MKPDAFPKPSLLPSSERKTLVIAGASGLIGSALTPAAQAQGHTVRHLVRRAPEHSNEFQWNPAAHFIDPDALLDADVVVNLSGASISKMPWTARYKHELLQSRLDATQTLVHAMNTMDAPPSRFLSGSAVGIYGHASSDAPLTEDSRGTGFLAELCQQWEDAALTVQPKTAVTLLRTGLVLSHRGGMLPVVARIARLGGAGKLGNGRQHWPWISIDDYTAALLHIVQSGLTGPVNLSAPTQTTAAEFMRTLANVLHRPYLLPAPAFALKAVLGDAGRDLLLANQPVAPAKLHADGFRFRDTNLRLLLERLLVESDSGNASSLQ